MGVALRLGPALGHMQAHAEYGVALRLGPASTRGVRAKGAADWGLAHAHCLARPTAGSAVHTLS